MKLFTCPQTGLVRDGDDERERYKKRCDAIAYSAAALRRAELERIIAKYELESDEFGTAEEKADNL